mmetsp:Transcript_28108/g.53169  ORF Transcript_28108/g.53169 Transcript_28108/m.53169 type:complete len:478 (+) Transcript_28108:83-1516(+)
MSRRPFLRESPTDKLFRYRGVVLVVSVPVLLLLLVVGLMPRGSPQEDLPPLPRHKDPQEAEPKAIPIQGEEQEEMRYAVVLDAGSTGSRVHTYRFRNGEGGGLELVDDDFHQLKPGLSSFKDDPDKGAASLAPLLDAAKERVPASAHASTPIELRATAGLRLLPEAQAEALLSAARTALEASPFSVAKDAVSIMEGADEGAFQWVTINYLLGKLGGAPSKTVAAVDLGGGSVQMARALHQNDAAAAPKGYVRQLRGGGASYHVYVHSYLGYGLMAARAAVLHSAGARGGHPCVLPGTNTTYSYAGAKHHVQGREHTEVDESFASCSAVVQGALNKDKACKEGPADECSFDGVWGGGASASSSLSDVHLSSYFFDRAQQAGLVGEDVISGDTTPGEFGKAAVRACGAESAEAAAIGFSGVGDSDAPYLCIDLTFCHTLLTQGFGLGSDAQLKLVKRIPYQGTEIEAAWPLGAAINSLG